MVDQRDGENSHLAPPGTSQEVNPAVRPGDVVRARGDGWRVRELRSFSDCAFIRLVGVGCDNRGVARTLLWPFDRPASMFHDRHPRCVGRRHWMHALRSLLADEVEFGRLRAAAAARIDLFDWQLEPALATVRDLAPRILLADEVGLGKTIQAGLVLAELLTRGQLLRAIILTPPGLRDQWADELRTRFGIDATVVDAAALRRQVTDLPAGMNPWAVWPVAIASLDFVKQPEVLRGLAALLWDLLIIDEAHQTATARERGAAVHALGTLARRVVLLTATPHAGDADPFSALCDTGRLSGEGPIVMFRRSRRDVGLATPRRVRLLAVQPTAAERSAHELLERYTARVWREARQRGDGDARLAMIVLRKRALSSMTSLASSVERRLSWLSGRQTSVALQLPLPLADPDDVGERQSDDDEPDLALQAPGLTDAGTELDLLTAVLDAAKAAARAESKLAALTRLLHRAAEPAIVFTEYRDTLSRIATVIGAHTPIAVLHGGLSRAERLAAERSFTAGAATVLMTTDAGGQGLNLHHRCRLVVNVELPWNPMRVEQRIGRVDRIGQRHRVHAVHLLASGTGEELILGRLVERLRRARKSLGFVSDPIGSVTEDQVAAAMMDGTPADFSLAMVRLAPLTSRPRKIVARGLVTTTAAPTVPPSTEAGADAAAPFVSIDLRADAGREVERLQWLRRLLEAGRSKRARKTSRGSTESEGRGRVRGDIDITGPWVAAVSLAQLRRRRDHHQDGLQLPEGLVALFISRVVDGGGGLIEERIVPILVRVGCSRNPGQAALKELFATRLSPLLPTLRQRAAAEALARLRQIERVRGPGLGHARLREAAIARAVEDLDAVRRHGPIQQGLFDRRALRQAEQLRQQWQRLHEEASTRVAGVDRSSELSLAGEPELVLVLAITP
jgi:superfamily II DNA or RNA helicase